MAKNKKINIVFWIFIIFVVMFFVRKIIKTNNKNIEVKELKVTEGDIWPPRLKEGQGIKLEDNLIKKNYYIIFDGSGSMNGDKIVTAKKALIEFVKFVPIESNLGLAIFDGHGLSERVPLGGDRRQFIDQVNQTKAEGGTPLKEAIELAYSKINEQARKQLGYGEYNIVIVTDGEANSGHEPDKIVKIILKDSPVIIHTIGFQIGENHSLNQPGKILYKSAKNLNELSKGLEEVLAESESFVVTDFK